MIRFILRLSNRMHRQIKELAAQKRRSMHAQIVYILEKYLENRQ